MSGAGSIVFNNSIVDRDTVGELIAAGEFLIIAGDERVLRDLPAGNWIAGTIPYFMTNEGGRVDQDAVYVTRLQGLPPGNPPRLTLYDASSISRIAQEAPQHGFTVLILPASSEVHLAYAQNAPDFPNMYFSPIIGWISGVHLDELAEKKARVGFGPAAGLLSEDRAAAMHITLPEDVVANVRIVNLFTQGDGPTITFPDNGFSVSTCSVDGREWNFAEYLTEHKIDTRLPLVANYCGVMVNVSIQSVNASDVTLYAPVFPGVEYKFARPVGDYVSEFNQALPAAESEHIAYSCNCILNYLYSELDGKKTGALIGPFTFGEVAYQLLNQTLVYLTLEKA